MPYEGTIRLSVFLGVLLVMALLEGAFHRRERRVPRLGRWSWNLGMVVFDTICLRAVAQFVTAGLAAGAAILAAERGWGLFNLIPVPGWIAGVVCFFVLDFAIYGQHVAFHKIPLLWRLHKVHHTDIDVDVTTALRFHPVEILLSMGIKVGLVLLLGAPALSVLLFEVALNGAAMFNHANFRMPARADRLLRLLLVTPDMHRVHHSTQCRETNSNYGFNFPWWDRLCGTYRDQPEHGHEAMQLGLKTYRDAGRLHLGALLLLPFHAAESGETPPEA